MRYLVACVMMLALVGCAANQQPRSVEGTTAIDARLAARQNSQLAGVLMTAARERRMPAQLALDAMTQVNAIDQLGFTLTERLADADDARTPEQRATALTAAYKAASTMDQRADGIGQMLAPVAPTIPDVMDVLSQLRETIQGIAAKLNARV